MTFTNALPNEVSVTRGNPPICHGSCADKQAEQGTLSYTGLEDVPIPTPRAQVMAQMQALAALVGGPVDTLEFSNGSTAGFRLPMTKLIILGTACRRPLMFEEGQEVQRVMAEHIVIVRLNNDPSLQGIVTYDALPMGSDRWLEHLRLWQQPCGSMFALAPSEGEGQSLLLSPWRLDTICRAPFYSLFEREAGFKRAAYNLRRVREGR